MLKLVPRYYQDEAVDSIFKFFEEEPKGNPLVVMPTGTGKGYVIALFLERVYSKWPNQKIVVGTHVKKLIQQNFNQLIRLWPNAPAGINSAGLGQRDTMQRIIFAGIASIRKQAQLLGIVDLFLIDEAHLVSPNEKTMYRFLINELLKINPYMRVIGFTATKYRMGQGELTEEGGLFTHVCYDITGVEPFNRLIAEAYLMPLLPKRTKFQVDTDGLHLKGGEFIESEVQDLMDRDEVTFEALKETVAIGIAEKRWSWMVFTSGIKHSENVAIMLRTMGIEAYAVHSGLPEEECDKIIKDFSEGKFKAIVSANKLTTGVDIPQVDMIVILRPTQSPVLWVQILGRGTRPLFAPGYDLSTFEGRIAAIKEYGKLNCIAEGQKVLTDKGLIAIEKVTLEMKVWDGVEFVSHDGIIYKGVQEVITYAGLTATPDHKVYTKEGWKAFGDCAIEQTPISITGNGWWTIQQSDGDYRGNIENSWESAYRSSMSNLQKHLYEGIQFSKKKISRLRSMRKFTNWKIRYAEMVSETMYRCERSMHESKKQKISRLWWERDSISFSNSYNNGCMDSGKLKFHSRYGNRSNRQRWSLSTRKYSFCSKKIKYEQPTWGETYCESSRLSIKTSRNKISSHNNSRIFLQRFNRETNNKTILQKICKTERRVWDICNAGQRHRFTVEGLLVSNCRVLDYTGNSKRLGPVNDPILPHKKGKKKGSMPIKVCVRCDCENHISARICQECGLEFIIDHKLKQIAQTNELIKDDLPISEVFEIEKIVYQVHQKMNTPEMLKVSYYSKFQVFHEFQLLEHEGLSKKAGRWWRDRAINKQVPITSREALSRINELKPATHVRVWVNHKPYPDILAYCFDGSAFGTQQPAMFIPKIQAVAAPLSPPKGSSTLIPDDDTPPF